MFNCGLLNIRLSSLYIPSTNNYRKELLTKLHNLVHLNLCIALSMGLLLFLTGIQTATANIVSDSTVFIGICTRRASVTHNVMCYSRWVNTTSPSL